MIPTIPHKINFYLYTKHLQHAIEPEEEDDLTMELCHLNNYENNRDERPDNTVPRMSTPVNLRESEARNWNILADLSAVSESEKVNLCGRVNHALIMNELREAVDSNENVTTSPEESSDTLSLPEWFHETQSIVT